MISDGNFVHLPFLLKGICVIYTNAYTRNAYIYITIYLYVYIYIYRYIYI
jgi:hypothetical protein